MLAAPRCSRAVPHPSTERAQRSLTSEFGWDPVHYTWYGRKHKDLFVNGFYMSELEVL